ncbi:NADP oxidoreductase [Marmoricola endophyticus]|uniref:NADP oxidoreductase n=1 Tax=Marmoricola endophyticus TaxID=2040280 RepID=A0A917F0K7_9ACTN|nr:NAD(P)-binding domain-containing protein [Marmoricola endophyticus]GGF32861.1 NADP oxidoreductase [Marmoricola endophyticus]
MTTIGFIGSGNIGSTLARLAVDAGYDVVMSNSRGPDTLADLVESLGPRARAATREEAAAAGDLVVTTVPLKALEDVPVEPLAGKLVLDTINYYPDRDGAVPALDENATTTSELVAAHLPRARVVKAFNNIYFEHLASMARPSGADDRNTLLIAGDDEQAKTEAAGVIDALGYDTFDTGALADSWRFERDRPAYAAAYTVDGDFSRPRVNDRAGLAGLLEESVRQGR